MLTTVSLRGRRRRCNGVLYVFFLMILSLMSTRIVADADAATNTTTCMDAGRARVTSLLPGECATDESCSVCAMESSLANVCGSEMVCRVLSVEKSSSGDGAAATSADRDIKIEEQWMLVPVATNGSSLDKMQQDSNATLNVQKMTQVLSTGHLTIDGWGVVDGKPNMTLALADNIVAGFSNLTVLKLRNLSLQYIQLPALPKLHTLDLSGDGLMVLDGVLSREVFAKSSQPLLTLSLQHNMLIEIPTSVFEMPSLRVLQLQHNAIKKQRLSPAQFDFLSKTLTKLEIDADAFQTSGCKDKLVTFVSNPSISICDPSLWLQVSGSSISGDSSSSAASQNQKSHQSSESSTPWSAWVGGISAFLVIVAAIAFAMTRKQTFKEMLQGRQRDSREHNNGVTVFRDAVQQQSDAECYRVFQDTTFSDSSTLSLTEQMFESWRRDPRLIARVKPLGSKGKKSRTWMGTYRGDNVVIKLLPNKATESERTLFTFDMKTIARFSHPNLIRFRGVAWSSDNGMQALLEYMDRGDLHTYLTLSRSGANGGSGKGTASAAVIANGGPSLACWWGTRLLDIALDVAQALLYLHTMKRLSHCALTSRHVLLNHEYSAKLSNFMFVQSLAEYGAPSPKASESPSFESERAVARKACTEFVRWSAPEVLTGASPSEASDIYSFGIILSELSTLDYPFERIQREKKWSEVQLLQQLKTGSLLPSISQACPAPARELLLACLAKDPCDRPTAATVVQTLREIVADIDRESSLSVSYFTESAQAMAVALEQ